ncbi:MAG: type II toxin-antitoxin system RelE/ParE family toxin [Candidatus Poribacteria bacterium]|nr:type II toxin-antitoxin system RelE/ParE family toxin [Candidatus Poribacteria bacterium]
MQIRPREILHYITSSGSNPYQRWYMRIKDQKTQIAISNRISRLRSGNFGDFKRLNKDLYELRIHYGPGYRVYFGVFQYDIVILLCGGTKGTQRRDIIRAQNYWDDFLEQMRE